MNRARQSSQPNIRYFVPDLSPMDQPKLKRLKPKFVFVAESPHVSEVEPLVQSLRRPLCGVAGRQWWGMLSELLEGQAHSDVSLDRFLEFCLAHEICVINAVQYPLDPKIAVKYPDADPSQNLGFNKVSGAYSYKKLKKSDVVQSSLELLRKRLTHPSLAQAKIVCLGNDAEWFVNQALSGLADLERIATKVPHPSAWWRQDGLFGRIARERLTNLFKDFLVRKVA